MEEKYCQSCSMPMGATDEFYGTNVDGTKSDDYCSYCFEKGEFTFQGSMAEMINICVPYMVEQTEMNENEARTTLQMCLPQLKRWR